MATETITIKMNWSGALAPLLAVYENGSPKGRADAIGELRNMARVADLYVEDNPPAEFFQCLELVETDNGKRWKFIAHGATYAADEARALVERYAERDIKVRLLPASK